ncbi:endoplasmic reticulum junction formation protein lunapark-A-like isoform X2 [Littorina saxatilis]|uniref:endoplasmic reticulum junction formation protein lunapark-A-like isoform X2 n=1 Tax=Littorina saxatilis TaxID=31220 RepID=UPI0038B562C0
MALYPASKSTIEVLESIEKDISCLQRCRRENQQLQKKVAASILLYSIVLYIVALVLFYFLYLPEKWRDRALYSIPLLVFPFLVWGARKLMHWYFVKRVSANDLAVNELREKKKLILEDVMEKETYKKAKEILEKFDPARFKKLEQKTETPIHMDRTPGTTMRQRVVVQPVSPSPRVIMSPRGPRPMATPGMRPQWNNSNRPSPVAGMRNPMSTPIMRYSPPPGPPMPRTVLPKDRGTMDKFIDYLVGDGPQNRFALVCRFCSSHNGMALPEEFEYLSFRCCYCYNMNQARKMRPFAPKLEFPEVPAPNRSSAQSSDAESDKEAETGKTKAEEDNSADGDEASESEEKKDSVDTKEPQQAAQPEARPDSSAQQTSDTTPTRTDTPQDKQSVPDKTD